MSLTLTLTGNSSELSAYYFPPIELENDQYVVGLVDFQTFHSIPNIDKNNNKFYYDNDKVIVIPEGSYEIEDINQYLRKKILSTSVNDKSKKYQISINANNNTLKCELVSNCIIDFTKDNTIGPLLGFSKRKLEPNILHTSELPINILKVNAILVECNITASSYKNDKPVHIIHEFFPTVPPGYKIIEVPSNVIYLPVNVRTINNITLRITDQDGNLINFRKENITIRLHLKKV